MQSGHERTALAVRLVEEVRSPLDVPVWVHPEWSEHFPWLVQGATGAGDADDPFDLGLAGVQPVGAALDRWRRLRAAAGMHTIAHARQVHGAEVWTHTGTGAPGIAVMDGVDGHVSGVPGLLLAVGIADCVPVSIVDSKRRFVALLHSGWRGTAGGIVETGIRLFVAGGSSLTDLWLHCGPAICGACYEVGAEVHEGVRPWRAPPTAPAPIDLRAAIAERSAAAGVAPDRITLSTHCTRCGPGAFFSHRAGSACRQMGILGIR